MGITSVLCKPLKITYASLSRKKDVMLWEDGIMKLSQSWRKVEQQMLNRSIYKYVNTVFEIHLKKKRYKLLFQPDTSYFMNQQEQRVKMSSISQTADPEKRKSLISKGEMLFYPSTFKIPDINAVCVFLSSKQFSFISSFCRFTRHSRRGKSLFSI